MDADPRATAADRARRKKNPSDQSYFFGAPPAVDAVHMDEWRAQRKQTLEIANPTAICGACGFTSSLSGVWSVEDGRLVFRADPDPLQRRGPDFFYCGESREVVEFTRCEVDGHEVPGDAFAALRAEAERARDA